MSHFILVFGRLQVAASCTLLKVTLLPGKQWKGQKIAEVQYKTQTLISSDKQRWTAFIALYLENIMGWFFDKSQVL